MLGLHGRASVVTDRSCAESERPRGLADCSSAVLTRGTDCGAAQTIDRRHDWCDAMRAVNNGSLALRDAMRGRQLSVSLTRPPHSAPLGFVNVDADTGAVPQGRNAGFMIEVLDEVAARAGFSWRDSFSFFDNPETFGKTWTDLVQWQIGAYDLSGEWWVPTMARRERGVSVVEGFFDSSLVLVAQQQGTEPRTFAADIGAWSKPMRAGVWVMAVFFSLVVGIAYAYIEEGEQGSDLDRDDRAGNYTHSILSALLLSTRVGAPRPRSLAGMLLVFGWSCFALVLVSCYVANMVLMLMDEHAPARFVLDDMRDAVVRALPVCVWEASAAGEVLRAKLPTLNSVQSSGTSGLTQVMAGGLCEGGCARVWGSARERRGVRGCGGVRGSGEVCRRIGGLLVRK